MKMIIDYYSRMKYAKTIAKNAGLGLKESNKVTVPYTDGNTVYVPTYSVLWDKGSDEEVLWWYDLLHECYHNIYPEDFALLKKYKIDMSSPLGMILNIAVDHNIECGQHGQFSGRDTICDNGRLLGVNKRFDTVNDAVTNNKWSEDSAKIEAVFALDLFARHDWQLSLRGVGFNKFQKDTLEFFDRIAHLKDEYVKFKSSQESYDLALTIKDLLDFPDNKDEQGNAQPNQITGDNEGEVDEFTKKLVEEILSHMHGEEGTEPSPGDSELVNSNTTPKYTYEDGVYRPSNHEVADFVTNTNVNRCGSQENVDYSDLLPSNKLSKSIRKYLISSKKARYEGGRKAGRMDKRRAWRATAMAGSAGCMNVRKQAVNKSMVNTAVTVLIDNSGSMAYDKYKHAAHCAIMLNETLGKINIPVEIIGFTTTSTDSLEIVHKTFSSKVTNSKLATQFEKSACWMDCNSDGDSIMWASDRLLQRKEKRKVMIILSDGSPVPNGQGNIRKFTKDVVKQLEKHIDIHGIGIMSDAVRDYYKSNTVIDNADELENSLFTILKDKVLK